jgi:hypothetical protein
MLQKRLIDLDCPGGTSTSQPVQFVPDQARSRPMLERSLGVPQPDRCRL